MGRNPSVGGFRRDKIKNWPRSFPRTTRKGYGKDTKARLEIFRKVKLSDLTTDLEQLSLRSQTKVMGGSFRKIKLLQRKVKLSDLTTQLEKVKLQYDRASGKIKKGKASER
jgi:hypothetical protein